MTKTEFRMKAERAFLKANPTGKITGWIAIKLVKYPTGIKEFYGRFHAVADGYRPSVMIATGADDYVMVR